MTSVTIGLDVSDRYSRMCVLDSKGRVMEEGRVRTSPEGLARRFGCEEPARVVLEVGTHSPWMSEQLKQLGHEVLVANPRRLKLIYGEHDKTDRLDAEHLARVGRMDPKLLKTVQHRGRQARADLAVMGFAGALDLRPWRRNQTHHTSITACWTSSRSRNADIARNCPSVRRMGANWARLRRCSSSKMGKHRLVGAPDIRAHFATTIGNDHLLQATRAAKQGERADDLLGTW